MTPNPDQTRQQSFHQLAGNFDVLVLGGGATGLGIALDAVTRGYRTALVEAGDFAHATSSRSTKLVHGGVRYLASGQIHLVREALHERAVMQRIAPHLVHPLPTILPATHLWQLPYYGAGLIAYDLLSGASTMGPTRILSRKAVVERVTGIASQDLSGGILYHDAQFNDARYALAIARAAIDHGATILNYVRCTSLRYSDDSHTKITGAIVEDTETGTTAEISARTVINATGIFSDDLRTLDQPGRRPLLSVSRGSHIVLPTRFLGGNTALMIPKTDDGRVIFAIPWQGVILIGTTDIPATTSLVEPNMDADEIDYLLRHIAPYLKQPIARTDILSVFSGLRPLVTGKEKTTSRLSREHHIDASASGLITIAGGKWTTYRRMAQDTLDFAIRNTMLPPRECVTRTVSLRGCPPPEGGSRPTSDPVLAEYGTDIEAITDIARESADLREQIDAALPYSKAMAVYAIRHESARTVEDVLSRRTRSLLLNAAAAMRAAPWVAEQMARELGRDPAWIQSQIETFQQIAQAHYLPQTAAS